MNLRMTDAAAKELYQDLVRRRIRKLNFIHDQWLVRFHQDCRPTFNAHGYFLLAARLQLL
jgi:hypothetical protein